MFIARIAVTIRIINAQFRIIRRAYDMMKLTVTLVEAVRKAP